MLIHPSQERDIAKAIRFLSKTDVFDARILSYFSQTLTASDR